MSLIDKEKNLKEEIKKKKGRVKTEEQKQDSETQIFEDVFLMQVSFMSFF